MLIIVEFRLLDKFGLVIALSLFVLKRFYTSTLARMGFTVNENFNSSWLTDNRDTTCNRRTLRSVTVTLDTPIPLTWLRVAFSHAGRQAIKKVAKRSRKI